MKEKGGGAREQESGAASGRATGRKRRAFGITSRPKRGKGAEKDLKTKLAFETKRKNIPRRRTIHIGRPNPLFLEGEARFCEEENLDWGRGREC